MRKRTVITVMLFIAIIFAFWNIYTYREQSFYNLHPEINETRDINYVKDGRNYQNIEFDYNEFINVIEDCKIKNMRAVNGYNSDYIEIRLDGIIFDFYYNDTGYIYYGIIVSDLKNDKHYFYEDIDGNVYKYLKSCLE